MVILEVNYWKMGNNVHAVWGKVSEVAVEMIQNLQVARKK